MSWILPTLHLSVNALISPSSFLGSNVSSHCSIGSELQKPVLSLLVYKDYDVVISALTFLRGRIRR